MMVILLDKNSIEKKLEKINQLKNYQANKRLMSGELNRKIVADFE